MDRGGYTGPQFVDRVDTSRGDFWAGSGNGSIASEYGSDGVRGRRQPVVLNPVVDPRPDRPTPRPDRPDPVRPDPVKPDPVKPDPVKPDPVRPDPVKVRGSNSRLRDSRLSVNVPIVERGEALDTVQGEADKTLEVLKCKPRPEDNRAKGGGGSIKRFVPWCR